MVNYRLSFKGDRFTQAIFFLVLLLVIILTACGSPTPSKTFAPNGKVVERSISVSLTQAQQNLGDH